MKNSIPHHYFIEMVGTATAFDQEVSTVGELTHSHVGVSENVGKTPLYPMVLLIIIPFLNGYFIGNIPNIFRQTHVMYSGHIYIYI